MLRLLTLRLLSLTVGPTAAEDFTAESSAAGALDTVATISATGGPALYRLVAPTIDVFQPSVEQALESTPKPIVACTDTQTEPVQSVSPAPQLVCFLTSTTISATVWPNFSSGVVEPLRESSKGAEGAQPVQFFHC